MLGLARRAGRLSMGHDAALQSVRDKKARLVMLCSDVSPRLVGEFKRAVQRSGTDIPVFETQLIIDEIYFFVGYRAGVITVDDENFAHKIISLLTQEENANGN